MAGGALADDRLGGGQAGRRAGWEQRRLGWSFDDMTLSGWAASKVGLSWPRAAGRVDSKKKKLRGRGGGPPARARWSAVVAMGTAQEHCHVERPSACVCKRMADARDRSFCAGRCWVLGAGCWTLLEVVWWLEMAWPGTARVISRRRPWVGGGWAAAAVHGSARHVPGRR